MTRRYRRPINQFEVAARHKSSPVAVASPLDFELHYLSSSNVLAPSSIGVVYCADFESERALFTVCDDIEELFRAPFLYTAQFERAMQVTTAPFEHLDEIFPIDDAQPVFIFSVGRCGSTLLSLLLNEAGIRTASEPDILTQVASLRQRNPWQASSGAAQLLVRACVGSLRTHLGSKFVIKLRSQCNGIAAEIAQAIPRGIFVFMLRGRVAWARSRYRAFGGDPQSLARMFRWGIDTYHHLSIAGCNPKLLWYEDLIEDPLRTIRQLGISATTEDDALSLRAVMRRDSQDGSSLARQSLGERNLSADQLRAFENEWELLKPVQLITRYSLERIG